MKKIIISVFCMCIVSVTMTHASITQGPWTIRTIVDGYYATTSPKSDSDTPYGFIYSYSTFTKPKLNYALCVLDYSHKNVYSELGVHTGGYVQDNYKAEPNRYKALYSAFLGYRITDTIAVDAGIFPSHIGMESAIAKDNVLTTRALSSDNTPYYESGIRATLKPNEKWMIMALILNGWQVIKDNNDQLAMGTQIQYRPYSSLLLNSSTYVGNEALGDKAAQYRLFHNAYMVYDVSDHLQYAASLDLGWQDSATKSGMDMWHSWFVQASYKTGNKWAYAARIERYSDQQGIIIGQSGFQASGYSLNADYQINKRLLSRMEIKALNLDTDRSAILGTVALIYEL